MMKRALALLAVLLFAFAARAATVPNFPGVPRNYMQSWVQGVDAVSTYKTIYQGGANGSKCSAVIVNNGDVTNSHGFALLIGMTSFSFVAATVTLPAGVGLLPSAPIAVNVLQSIPLPIDSDGNAFIYLKPYDTLQGAYSGAFASGSSIVAMAICADF